MKFVFPKNFLWGSSTSGAQIEGAFFKDGKSANKWDTLYEQDRPRFYNYKNVENDWYHNYKSDIQLAKNLHFNALRISIQWTRLMPDGKTVSEKAVEFYRNVLKELKAKGIKTYVCLFHFDMPTWALNIGGWQNDKVVDAFVKYAKVCFEKFTDLVDVWFTFNQPTSPIERGYLYLAHPPEEVNIKHAMAAHINCLYAHQLVVREYKKLNLKPKIGVVLIIMPGISRSNGIEDLEATKIADAFQWRSWLDPIVKGTYPQILIDLDKKHHFLPEISEEKWSVIKGERIDVLGFNYYNPQRIRAVDYVPNFNQTVMTPKGYYFDNYILPGSKINLNRGWENYPRGIYQGLKTIQNEYNNIETIITENGTGIMDEDKYRDPMTGRIVDDYRMDYIGAHLAWINRAMQEGMNCVGYLMWTYIDNWSWTNAYKNRYGFYELNLETKARIPKASAAWFKNIAETCILEYDETKL